MADTTSISTVPKQQLIELINADNTISLSLTDVSLSDPVAGNFQHTEGNRNTKVTVSALSTSSYTGAIDVFYNRLALSDLGPVGILSSTPITPDQLLQFIATKRGIAMLADEFQAILIPVLEVGQAGTIQLVAKSTAIKWYGQLAVDYAMDLPVGLDALDQLVNATLPGYHWLG